LSFISTTPPSTAKRPPTDMPFGLTPHLSLFARWLMVPVLCAGLLAVFWQEGRLQPVCRDLAALRWPRDWEAAAAVLFSLPIAAAGLYNSWQLIARFHL
jgi:hypothetical protein